MKHKGLKITAIILACIMICLLVVNVLPSSKFVEENPFIVSEGELPLLAAHRGGGRNNPENTMLAFREAIDTYRVDIIESDLWMTADGYLVYNHDGYIDRTSNVNGDIPYSEVKELVKDEANRHYIKDMTLAELKSYNFGYYFEDENGERIYKDVTDTEAAGLQIATVEQLFEEFYESNPELLFIVEIKNEGELGYRACDILARVLKSYPRYEKQTVVGTFHGEIEEKLKESYPHLMRGASTESAAAFVLTHFAGVNNLYNGGFGCLQIPMSYDLGIEVKLDNASIIDRAHKRGVAVQYWTINDADEMRHLIGLGCDAIMTDDPALLREILEEYTK